MPIALEPLLISCYIGAQLLIASVVRVWPDQDLFLDALLQDCLLLLKACLLLVTGAISNDVLT